LKSYTVTAICEKDSEVLYMSKNDYFKLQSNPVIWGGLRENAE